MPAIALNPSTIELITERMKKDGYSSPDALVCEALASFKPPQNSKARAVASASPDSKSGNSSETDEEIDLDLSYDPVPLQVMSVADVKYLRAGELEMIPFDRDI